MFLLTRLRILKMNTWMRRPLKMKSNGRIVEEMRKMASSMKLRKKMHSG